ncbi:MAG TPA: hypothetical protein VNQ79_08575 [Blastocatellia bacterium]|nr:hypothetical protein [Blastocatellia bacterium]
MVSGPAHAAVEILPATAPAAAAPLFTLGLVGTGMLGVSALAGSAVYAIAGAMRWLGWLTAIVMTVAGAGVISTSLS